MPERLLPASARPSAVVPIQLPVTEFRLPFSIARPIRKRLMIRPLIVLWPPLTQRPS